MSFYLYLLKKSDMLHKFYQRDRVQHEKISAFVLWHFRKNLDVGQYYLKGNNYAFK